MLRWLLRAAADFDRLLRWLALLGGVVLVGIVLLTVADVALRKLANAPIFGAQNITELALLVVVFASIAHCGREGGHVAVDLIGNALSAGALRVSGVLVNLVGAAMLGVLSWRAVAAAQHAMAIDRTSNLLAIPHWPFYYVIVVGSALYALVQLIEAVRIGVGHRSRNLA